MTSFREKPSSTPFWTVSNTTVSPYASMALPSGPHPMPMEKPTPDLDLLLPSPFFLQSLHLAPLPSKLLRIRTAILTTAHPKGHSIWAQKGHLGWAAKPLPIPSLISLFSWFFSSFYLVFQFYINLTLKYAFLRKCQDFENRLKGQP